MKNILIIHTGGTFGMSPIEPTKTLKPGNIQSDIEKYLPEVHRIANLEIQIPFNKDSTNIGPHDWKLLFSILKREMNNYDGFVIIHGTDTLVYTASALSFLLGDLQKPLILTGSQRPLSSIRSDAKSNLINALELATMDIPEVAICFGNNLFRGNRTKKISIESYHGFESPNYPPLATIGLNIHLKKQNILKDRININLQPEFDPSAVVIHVTPGLNPQQYLPMIAGNTRVFILSGFGAGNLPNMEQNWIEFISKAADKNKLVFIGSQSPHGQVDLELYDSGILAKNAGALSLDDMTIESALVKSMLLLANFEDPNIIKKYFEQPLAGEKISLLESGK